MFNRAFKTVANGIRKEAQGKVPGFGLLTGSLESLRGDQHPVDDADLEPLLIIEQKIDALMEAIQSSIAPPIETHTQEDAHMEYIVKLHRLLNYPTWTVGMMEVPGFGVSDSPIRAFTLEDQHQDVKIAGETRIPAGRYPLGYRTEGGKHQDYSELFPHFHKGMIHIQEVPNFTYVLIHIGNTEDNTDACVLVADQFSFANESMIGSSKPAYERIYKAICVLLDNAPGNVFLNVTDDVLDGGPAPGADQINVEGITQPPRSEVAMHALHGLFSDIDKLAQNSEGRAKIACDTIYQYLRDVDAIKDRIQT